MDRMLPYYGFRFMVALIAIFILILWLSFPCKRKTPFLLNTRKTKSASPHEEGNGVVSRSHQFRNYADDLTQLLVLWEEEMLILGYLKKTRSESKRSEGAALLPSDSRNGKRHSANFQKNETRGCSILTGRVYLPAAPLGGRTGLSICEIGGTHRIRASRWDFGILVFPPLMIWRCYRLSQSFYICREQTSAEETGLRCWTLSMKPLSLREEDRSYFSDN